MKVRIDRGRFRHAPRDARGQLHLTPKEFELLRYLAAHPNKVLCTAACCKPSGDLDYGDRSTISRVFVNQLARRSANPPARVPHHRAVGRLSAGTPGKPLTRRRVANPNGRL